MPTAATLEQSHVASYIWLVAITSSQGETDERPVSSYFSKRQTSAKTRAVTNQADRCRGPFGTGGNIIDRLGGLAFSFRR
jgi:hypothetical protein